MTGPSFEFLCMPMKVPLQQQNALVCPGIMGTDQQECTGNAKHRGESKGGLIGMLAGKESKAVLYTFPPSLTEFMATWQRCLYCL